MFFYKLLYDLTEYKVLTLQVKHLLQPPPQPPPTPPPPKNKRKEQNIDWLSSEDMKRRLY